MVQKYRYQLLTTLVALIAVILLLWWIFA